ncbi:hypothetical protein [Parasitella parasitica]|uniref:MIT domain-containing protein n=1 Tax=Parasitella parasitica TaxID=35722 RepID=A0A0B7NLR9_9FUNG|nr:hypothetical protein [Parasitella parasitica]
MSSFVSSILYNSANKSKQKSRNKSTTSEQTLVGSRLAVHGSTPVLPTNPYYQHPQMSYSAEHIPAPPPYDPMQQQLHSPTPSPSTSWTLEMSALAEKIRDDVTKTFKSSNSKQTANIDRHSISQGMKLVSIAADEYEQGNESVALDIYLTGVDKILMALPNKTDKNTKRAIKEKLYSVEERVGILNLATSQKRIQQQELVQGEEIKSSVINSFVLSRIASTISTISSRAYQSAKASNTAVPIVDITWDTAAQTDTHPVTPTIPIEKGDSMARFKQLGHYLTEFTVKCAILVKQSPLPGLVSLLFSYVIQLFLWFDSRYHVMQKAQDFGIQCIKLGLQADERYRLHEFLSEGLYMLIAAGLKIVVAFNEAPHNAGSSEQKATTSSNVTKHLRHRSDPIDTLKKAASSDKMSDQRPSTSISTPNTTATTNKASTATCLPQSPQKTKTSWIWPW